MRKLCRLLVFLFFVFLIFQCFVVFISKEHHIKYQIQRNSKTFLIEEKYQMIEGKDRYLFTINGTYMFDIFAPLHKTSRLISDILYYEDDKYTCIYPIFRSKKIKMDVLCKSDRLFYYHTIRGEDKKLDAFVSSISSYDIGLFVESDKSIKKELITIYPDNILDQHFLALQNYKGMYHISKEVGVQKDVFYPQDVYEPKLFIGYDKYVICAVDKGEDTFDELIIIRLDKNKQKKIKIPDTSMSSSFHLIEGKVYLEDKMGFSFLIDVQKGKYKKIDRLPKNSSKDSYDHDNFIQRTSFYHYLYQKVNGKIKVSRIFGENKDIVLDLFTVDSMDKITYYDDFIYFVSDDTLYCYSDRTGLKKVVTYEELNFNKSLSYFVYKKH